MGPCAPLPVQVPSRPNYLAPAMYSAMGSVLARLTAEADQQYQEQRDTQNPRLGAVAAGSPACKACCQVHPDAQSQTAPLNLSQQGPASRRWTLEVVNLMERRPYGINFYTEDINRN